ERFRGYGEAGRAAIAEPFRGLTADGHVLPNLYGLEPTGVSTQALRDAALAFLDFLTAEDQACARFAIDAPEWRGWSNIHAFVVRHGICLDDCTEAQRARGLDLLRATCSARGFRLVRDVMRLNDALAELTRRPQEFGERYYWLSIFGEPSDIGRAHV